MDIKQKIEKSIQEVLKNLKIEEINFIGVNFTVEHPENFGNGDFSTNVAMIIFRNIRSGYKFLAKDLSKDETTVYTKENFEKTFKSLGGDDDKANIYNYKNPSDIAILIKSELEKNLPKEISKVEVKNGFINFYLSKDFFVESVKEILEQKENFGKNNLLTGKKIMVEYTQPNPFKPFHIGHLMSNAIGESISRIVEFCGAKTVRANYQGDVGPHVAKAIWGMIYILKEKPSENESFARKAQYIGNAYHLGSGAYDENDLSGTIPNGPTKNEIRDQIEDINKQIYNYINKDGECDNKVKEYYDWGRGITLQAFEELYKLLGTKFDYYFFESDMAEVGKKIVKENVGKIFEESNGAIVFHGENYDKKLHTRVFINSQGLPTYETKEIGLTITKFEKENPDISIVTTAIEQGEYMKVVQKALSIIHPDLESRMKHITHGMMRLASGKMSSRKGNVITGESLLNEVQEKVFWKMMHSNPNDNKPVFEKTNDFNKKTEDVKIICEQVGVAALKYSILKSSLGSDIIFDFEKSISFDGDSGPYLQYTAVRANSILNKAQEFKLKPRNQNLNLEPNLEITNLEKLLYQFPDVVERSYNLLEPHHIATYLTELASAFNTFYGNTKILDTENKYISYHLDLVKSFYQAMKNGLWLLGIKTPEKM